MKRMVCLGDSFTEGMVDVRRADGHFTGWADRVALALARHAERTGGGPLEYANLAVRGKLLDQVVAEQLEAALGMRPDLVTFHAGPNDVLRPGTDFEDLMDRYEAAVATLAGEVDRVVLFTSLTRAGGSGWMADRLESRFARFNGRVREVAARHRCLLVDDEGVTALADRRFWGMDRLHLNEHGHARVAANVLATLGVTDPEILGGPVGWWTQPLPPAQPASRRDALAGDMRWLGTHLVPWFVRRLRGVSSGDGRTAKEPVPRIVSASGLGMR